MTGVQTCALPIFTASWDYTARVWDARTGQPLGEPLQHTNSVLNAQFSPDGLRVVTASADGTARVWDVPSVTPPAPDWLAGLAEGAVGKRLNERGLLEAVPADALNAVKARVSAAATKDPLSAWARWFLDDPGTRTISPYSSVTVPEYVRRRVAENTLESLLAVTRLNPTNGLAYARLAQAVLAEDPVKNPRRVGEADFFSRHALQWSPNDPEVNRLREEIVEAVGKLTSTRTPK